MKKLSAAMLIAAQLSGAPAVAASLEPIGAGPTRTSAFAGARLRIGLGGRDSGQLRAGLGIGPIRSVQSHDGRIRTSFGEGLQFGMRGTGPARLSVAGRSMEEIRLQADGKGGVPTWALVVGGVVIAVGIAAAVFIDRINDASD
ncbi:hypothetical protein [Sphingomonas sp.]|jgi:hypothetical protein|uniref:hypothetical protein n=1 Tax=Sphingomonas sp. TaxID=28214 RepID=UPI002DF57EF7|nr:hypothetical protein [Sphingomonas sp.]